MAEKENMTEGVPQGEGKPIFAVWLAAKLEKYGTRNTLQKRLELPEFGEVSKSALDSILVGRRQPRPQTQDYILKALTDVLVDDDTPESLERLFQQLQAEVKQIYIAAQNEIAESKEDVKEQNKPRPAPFYLPFAPTHNVLFAEAWHKACERLSGVSGKRTVNFFTDSIGGGHDELALHLGNFVTSGAEISDRGSLLTVSLRNISYDLDNSEKADNTNQARVERRILRQIGANTVVSLEDPMERILDWLGKTSKFVLVVVGIETIQAVKAFAKVARRLTNLNPRITLISACTTNQELGLEDGKADIPCRKLDVEAARTMLLDGTFLPSAEGEERFNSLFNSKARFDVTLPLILILRGLIWDNKAKWEDDWNTLVEAKGKEGGLNAEEVCSFAFCRMDVLHQELVSHCGLFTSSFPLPFLLDVLSPDTLPDKTRKSSRIEQEKWLHHELHKVALHGWISRNATSDLYLMNPFLRDYAYRQLTEEDKPQARRRFLERLNLHLKEQGLQPEVYVEENLSEIQLILDAVHQSLPNHVNEYKDQKAAFLETVELLVLHWERRGWYARGAENLEAAMALCDEKTDADRWQKVRLSIGRATLLYRKDDKGEAKKCLDNSGLNDLRKRMETSNRGLDAEQLLTYGRFQMAQGVIAHVHRAEADQAKDGETDEAFNLVKAAAENFVSVTKKLRKVSEDKILIQNVEYYLTWARIWQGRIRFDHDELDESLVHFRTAYREALQLDHARLLTVTLLSIARSEWGKIAESAEEKEKKWDQTDKDRAFQQIRRTLEYVSPLVEEEKDVSLTAHYLALNGLYNRARAANKPESKENKTRFDKANEMMATGFRAFSRISDLYWRAVYTVFRSHQEAFQGDKAASIDHFLKAVDFWDELIRRQERQPLEGDSETGKISYKPPRFVIERLHYVYNKYHVEIGDAGVARDVIAGRNPRDNKDEYTKSFLTWRPQPEILS